MSITNSFIFPVSGLGYARDACIAPFSGVAPASGLTNLVTASYEAGSIYTYSSLASGLGLIPIPTPTFTSSLLFGESTYELLGGQIPTTLLGSGLDFLNGASGGDFWANQAVSAGHSLQLQCNAGGIPGGVSGFNSSLAGVDLVITGTEVFQISYKILDNSPLEILFQFYESILGWHSVYLGIDEFLLGGHNAGPVPITIGTWFTFSVTAAQLGLFSGMIVTGLGWGVWAPANTSCNVLFSDITNPSTVETINQFVDCDQDGHTGFYVLGRQSLIHVPQVSTLPIVPQVTNLLTSPSFIYTGLVYNAANSKAYFIGYDGSVYSYDGSALSSVTAPPSGVVAPARQLYTDGSNLYTLFDNSKVVASYSIPSSGWSLKTTFPFTANTDVIYYSNDISKILAGGRNYIDVHSAATITDICYALTPNQLVIADASNNINFLNFTNGGWVTGQTVTGTGLPVDVASEPDGNQVLVTDTTNNVIQVLTNVAGTWSDTSHVSLTGPTEIVINTINGVTQAFICKPSQNQLTILNKAVINWNVSQNLTITNPTDVAIIATSANGGVGIVSTTTGITFIQYNGVIWTVGASIVLNPVPTIVASDSVNSSNNLLYAAASSGGNTTIYVFQNGTLVGQYSISGTLGQLNILNYQIFVSEASGTINGGYYVNGVTGQAVVSGVTTPTNPIASTWIPEVVDFFPSLLIANANDVWSFNVNKPQTLDRTTDSLIGVLTGSVWTTIDLVDRNKVSSITTDTSGNIFAVTVDNDIYKIASQTTIVSGYPYTLIPPAGQEEVTPLGLSKLLWWQNAIYASSSLMGGLTVVKPS